MTFSDAFFLGALRVKKEIQVVHSLANIYHHFE